MKASIKKITKKVVVLSLASALALGMSPIIKADAKATAPKITKDGKSIKTLVIVKGQTASLKIKKGTYEIKSVKWSSSKTKYATVNKKGVVKAIDYGNGKIKAVVTTKTDNKKYTLKLKFEVIEDEDGLEPLDMGDRGGWTIAESPLVDESLKAIVEKATAKETGLKIEPMSLLMTKENDGMNYRFFCKGTRVVPGAKTVYMLVEIHANLLGEAVIADIIDTEIEAYGTGNPSGWNEAETPVIAKGEGEIFNKAVSGLDGVGYNPIALLATQKVRGTEYCFIAEKTIVVPNAVPELCLVYVNAGENGEVTMGDVVNLIDTSASTPK